MPNYSKKSADKLATCNKPIQDLFARVVKHKDNTVICGLRTKAEQEKAFRNNASKVQFPNSKHNGKAPKHDVSDGIDAAPYPIPKGWGDINGISKSEISLDWKERLKFYQFAAIVTFEWSVMQAEDDKYKDWILTWGGDWDRDGDYTDNTFDDLVHFQIVKAKRKAKKPVEPTEQL